MRIGVLSTSFPRHEGDVAGSFVLGLAQALARRGHELDILAPEPALATTPPTLWEGLRLRWIPYLRPRALQRTFYGAGVPDNLRRDPSAWLGLAPFTVAMAAHAWRHVGRWDALLSHWALPSGLVASHVAAGRPHVAVLHSADVHLLSRLPGRALLAHGIAQGATALVCTSPALRESFLAALPDHATADARARSHVSPMGFAPMGCDRPTTPSRDTGGRSQDGRLRIVTMGRLVRVKGIDVALHALQSCPWADLIVAGSGPERPSLERMARQLGVHARFVGTVKGEAKRELIATANVFIAPSRVLPSGRTEGTPTAILEVMHAGLPVVASAVGGIPNLIGDGHNGLLVCPDDPPALARALTSLRHPALRHRLGTAARATAQRYAWEHLAPRFEAMLRGGGSVDEPSAVRVERGECPAEAENQIASREARG